MVDIYNTPLFRMLVEQQCDLLLCSAAQPIEIFKRREQQTNLYSTNSTLAILFIVWYFESQTSKNTVRIQRFSFILILFFIVIFLWLSWKSAGRLSFPIYTGIIAETLYICIHWLLIPRRKKGYDSLLQNYAQDKITE